MSPIGTFLAAENLVPSLAFWYGNVLVSTCKQKKVHHPIFNVGEIFKNRSRNLKQSTSSIDKLHKENGRFEDPEEDIYVIFHGSIETISLSVTFIGIIKQ